MWNPSVLFGPSRRSRSVWKKQTKPDIHWCLSYFTRDFTDWIVSLFLWIVPQILPLGFLKLLQDGSHMVMMECPEAVNTLLHEFLLWEPATTSLATESKKRPETAKAQCDNAKALSESVRARPATARQGPNNAEKTPDGKARKWVKIKADSDQTWNIQSLLFCC